MRLRGGFPAVVRGSRAIVRGASFTAPALGQISPDPAEPRSRPPRTASRWMRELASRVIATQREVDELSRHMAGEPYSVVR